MLRLEGDRAPEHVGFGFSKLMFGHDQLYVVNAAQQHIAPGLRKEHGRFRNPFPKRGKFFRNDKIFMAQGFQKRIPVGQAVEPIA